MWIVFSPKQISINSNKPRYPQEWETVTYRELGSTVRAKYISWEKEQCVPTETHSATDTVSQPGSAQCGYKYERIPPFLQLLTHSPPFGEMRTGGSLYCIDRDRALGATQGRPGDCGWSNETGGTWPSTASTIDILQWSSRVQSRVQRPNQV